MGAARKLAATAAEAAVSAAREAGLRYTSDATPGIRRTKHGTTFRYHGPNGRRVTNRDELARILFRLHEHVTCGPVRERANRVQCGLKRLLCVVGLVGDDRDVLMQLRHVLASAAHRTRHHGPGTPPPGPDRADAGGGWDQRAFELSEEYRSRGLVEAMLRTRRHLTSRSGSSGDLEAQISALESRIQSLLPATPGTPVVQGPAGAALSARRRYSSSCSLVCSVFL